MQKKPQERGNLAQTCFWMASFPYSILSAFSNLWISLVIHYIHKSTLWYKSTEKTTRPNPETRKQPLPLRIPSTKQCKQLSAALSWKHQWSLNAGIFHSPKQNESIFLSPASAVGRLVILETCHTRVLARGKKTILPIDNSKRALIWHTRAYLPLCTKTTANLFQWEKQQFS